MLFCVGSFENFRNTLVELKHYSRDSNSIIAYCFKKNQINVVIRGEKWLMTTHYKSQHVTIFLGP